MPKAGTSRSAGARNLANEIVASKNAPTTFPLAYVQMQLAHSLCQCSGHPKLNWRPRKLNTFADDLTNECFRRFDSSLRVELGEFRFHIDASLGQTPFSGRILAPPRSMQGPGCQALPDFKRARYDKTKRACGGAVPGLKPLRASPVRSQRKNLHNHGKGSQVRVGCVPLSELFSDCVDSVLNVYISR